MHALMALDLLREESISNQSNGIFVQNVRDNLSLFRN